MCRWHIYAPYLPLPSPTSHISNKFIIATHRLICADGTCTLLIFPQISNPNKSVIATHRLIRAGGACNPPGHSFIFGT